MTRPLESEEAIIKKSPSASSEIPLTGTKGSRAASLDEEEFEDERPLEEEADSAREEERPGMSRNEQEATRKTAARANAIPFKAPLGFMTENILT
jgi:hypothetical protein